MHKSYVIEGLIGIVGIGYLLLMPYYMSQNVFVDENALSPSATVAHMTQLDIINGRTLYQRYMNMSWYERVHREMFELEMESFDFFSEENVSMCRVSVVYGILRAKRSDGKECLVIISDYDDTLIGLLALLKYFSGRRNDGGARWLARDIVVVVAPPNGDVHAVNQWVRHYHDVSSGYDARCQRRNAGIAFKRAGRISSALALNIPSGNECAQSRVVGVNLEMAGERGVLPNMDYVSIALHHMKSLRVPVYIHRKSTVASNSMLFQFMVALATGQDSGYHAPFLKYRIDAISVNLLTTCAPNGGSRVLDRVVLLDVWRRVELICRTMNNALEKLHHATFYYLLISPERFITMSKYFVAFVILWLPVPLGVLRIAWTSPSTFSHTSICFLSWLLLNGGMLAFVVPSNLWSFVSLVGFVFGVYISARVDNTDKVFSSSIHLYALVCMSLMLLALGVSNFSLSILALVIAWALWFPFRLCSVCSLFRVLLWAALSPVCVQYFGVFHHDACMCVFYWIGWSCRGILLFRVSSQQRQKLHIE